LCVVAFLVLLCGGGSFSEFSMEFFAVRYCRKCVNCVKRSQCTNIIIYNRISWTFFDFGFFFGQSKDF
jgi:hypothetical protein